MICYIDSSVILRKILGHPAQYGDFRQIRFALASRLVIVECHRTLERYRLEGRLSDEQLMLAKEELQEFSSQMSIAKITDDVLERSASSFPTIIGSLDAIHLSTALIWREENGKAISMLTHDEQLARACRALNLPVLGS